MIVFRNHPFTVNGEIISDEKVLTDGIVAKNPNANYKIGRHVANGTGNPTQYISTSKNVEVIARYNKMTTGRIVVIETDGVNAIDISTKEGLDNHAVKGAIARNFALSSEEVLFERHIPAKNIVGIIDYSTETVDEETRNLVAKATELCGMPATVAKAQRNKDNEAYRSGLQVLLKKAIRNDVEFKYIAAIVKLYMHIYVA